MAVDRIRVEELFEAARGRATATERAAYLDDACGGDAALRSQVESLLKAHDEASGFLATVERPTPVNAADDSVGSRLGPYKLLQKLGEGGMGAVYMAEQEHPVRRRVALKIIKAGMDSAKVLARFDQERQALTMMDHPNIARALDAGATDTGRPYFVMELVKGIPITQYCDQEHLTPSERLALFIPVCQALQHAHQKGIIHRDIKPSNVLIALYDGRPVPKVIDFGVAKATSQILTERTMFTEVGSIVGTVEYMAPEQAELNNLDIDTRADIYSLGVLLYELLTGSPPFSSQQLRSAAFAEMLRMIREVEPPRPSTRLSSSEELASIAAHRKLEPRRLTKLVQYDLDWIVMKALEKDRGRRYETANALAQDVQRYLDDEPVLAGPPRAGYRLRKFLRRNKGPVLAAALVLLALVGGIMGTTWGLVRASQALDAETEQRQAAEKLAREKVELAEVVRHSRDRADRQSKLTLETLTSVVIDCQSKLRDVPGAQEVRRDLLSTAVDGLKQVARSLDAAVDGDHALVASLLNMGDAFRLAGVRGGATEEARKQTTEEARKQYQIAHDLAEKLVHDNPQDAQLQRDLAMSYLRIGDVNLELGNTEAARDAFQKLLEICLKLSHDDPRSALAQNDLAVSYYELGNLNLQLGNVAAARDAYLKFLEISQKQAQHDPKDAQIRYNLSVKYGSLGDANLLLGNAAAARDAYQKYFETSQSRAHDNPQDTWAQSDLANSFGHLGSLEMGSEDFSAATPWFTQGVAILEKLDQEGRIADQPLSQGWLAGQRYALEACQAAARAIENLDFALGRPKQKIPDLLGIRSRVLARQGKHADAAATAEKLAALEPSSGANLFQAAQGYALCAASMKPANSPAHVSAEEQALQDHYASRAVELLKQSHDAGYFNYPEKRAKLDQDRNLDSLRSRDDFKKLLAEIAAALPEKLPPPTFRNWIYSADEQGVPGSFFETGDSEWVEIKNGMVYAHFKLTANTPKYVELYDESRHMWIRLTQTDESYSTDQKQWHRLFKGAPVHIDAPKAESSPPPATDRAKSE